MARKLEVDIVKELRSLEIATKKIVESEIFGGYRSAFRGRGLEFEGFREYTSNDDASIIDWKASMKTDRLLVKDRVEERNLEINFIVDVSDKMVFGSSKRLKNEYAANVIASLAFMMIKAEDKVGITLFNDKIVKYLKSDIGEQQLYRIMKFLVNPDSYGGIFDIEKALKFSLERFGKNSLLFIISDFLGLPGEKWHSYLKSASFRFDIIVLIIRDPRDYTLPDESYQVLISDPASNRRLIIEPKLIKHAYEAYTKEQSKKLNSLFRSLNIDFSELITDKSFIQPLIHLFERRRAKWK